jgi:hypothetical protein
VDAEPTSEATAKVKPSPSAAVKYRANTKKVCTNVDKLFEGQELKRFARQLGTFILYKEAKKPVKAKRAQVKAKQELIALAAAVRATTSSAKDPKLKAAGKEAAAKIEKSAADSAFFAKLKTIKDVNPTLTSEMIPWLTPLGLHCP